MSEQGTAVLWGATHHRFLWPKNALGRPVRIRIAPRTPKPGSILVSSLEGSDVGVADAEWVAFAVLDVEERVGVEVIVTLTTTGMSVTVGMSEEPE